MLLVLKGLIKIIWLRLFDFFSDETISPFEVGQFFFQIVVSPFEVGQFSVPASYYNLLCPYSYQKVLRDFRNRKCFLLSNLSKTLDKNY